jgi:hypothetical protein
MGLLDPKVDLDRTMDLLRQRGVAKAVCEFEGGHDEGDVTSITLTKKDGSEEDFIVWYCGGYRMGPGPDYEYTPLSDPANADEELSDLLQGPVNERFGAWGGVPNTGGRLVWDTHTNVVTLSYSQETYADYEEVL